MFNMLQNKLLVTLTLGFALAAQTNPASAESDGLKSLSAQWWQWALSIPSSENPLLDTTGEKCMVGQRGSTWFLAGLFGGGAPVIRTCTVPDNVNLFFPGGQQHQPQFPQRLRPRPGEYFGRRSARGRGAVYRRLD